MQGVFVGIRWIYTHYSYRGTAIPDAWQSKWAFRAGYYYAIKNVKLYFGYQYLDFGYRGVSPHHYNFGINLYVGKSIHFDNKQYQPWQ